MFPAVVRSYKPETRLIFSGISRDKDGVALANCKVLIFSTHDNVLAAATTSDANGYWFAIVSTKGEHFHVKYKAGPPDVFGTSLNTRIPNG